MTFMGWAQAVPMRALGVGKGHGGLGRLLGAWRERVEPGRVVAESRALPLEPLRMEPGDWCANGPERVVGLRWFRRPY